MNIGMIVLAAGLGITTTAASAATVYSNTSTDLVQSVMYNDSGWIEIGDQILLDGTARSLTSASIQLFNRGSEGVFDAILRFYLPGSPVGAELGSFTRFGFTAVPSTGPEFGVFTISFDLGGLIVPSEVIFTLETVNLTSGVDLGLNLFTPPEVGDSDDTFFIAFEQSYTTVAGPPGNFYFRLEASEDAAVPEPASLGLTLAGCAFLCWLRSRRSPQ